jgi:predicted GIY-YIG superfamily endonuclease
MSFWVYILKCSDGSYYTGHTDNLERRIAAHTTGMQEGYTAKRRPLELVFSQEFATRYEALCSEFQIKGWTRRKKEALIKQDWNALKHLSRGKNKHDKS